MASSFNGCHVGYRENLGETVMGARLTITKLAAMLLSLLLLFNHVHAATCPSDSKSGYTLKETATQLRREKKMGIPPVPAGKTTQCYKLWSVPAGFAIADHNGHVAKTSDAQGTAIVFLFTDGTMDFTFNVNLVLLGQPEPYAHETVAQVKNTADQIVTTVKLFTDIPRDGPATIPDVSCKDTGAFPFFGRAHLPTPEIDFASISAANPVLNWPGSDSSCFGPSQSTSTNQ